VDDLQLHRASGPDLTASELYAALRLRAEVFVVEQECVYLDPDGRDLAADTVHLWLTDSRHATVAYLRLLTEPEGGSRIGRVVTARSHRGERLAGRLLDVALEEAPRPVVLAAQSHLVAVYERHGFVTDGAAYVEDGIPHTPMRLA
jgi:ElaA protein